MGNDLNHECIICGAKYHYCDTCKRMENSFTSWRTICDTSEHYQIYMVIRDYNSGIVSVEIAKQMLGQIGIHTLADIGVAKESAKSVLSKVLNAKDSIPEVKKSHRKTQK